MSWLEISLTVGGELAEAVADLFQRHAPGGVALQMEPDASGEGPAGRRVVVSAYLPIDARLEEKRRSIEEGLWHLSQVRPLPEPTYREIEDQDWEDAWKVHYRPTPVGRKLLIQPVWLEAEAGAQGRVTILMDPGQAFGTGSHPTTRLCLAALEDILEPGVVVGDLGCGSGILSVAAARLGARRVLAVDLDPLAVEATLRNAQANGVAQRVRVRAGGLQSLLALQEETGAEVQILLANILAKVLLQLLDEGLSHCVAPGGRVVMSGVLEGQAQAVVERAGQAGLELLEVRREEDWCALVFHRKLAP